MSLHAEVSQCVKLAVQQARMERPSEFERTVLALNALWDGISNELAFWLEVNPQGMTAQAAKHLTKLPGYGTNEVARRSVAHYIPPESVPAWPGLDEEFDRWVETYAAFLERTFFRRDLPQTEADPASPFSRWLKDNATVCFNHPDRSYRCVARSVQEAFKRRRPVVIVLLDALAITLVREAIEYIGTDLETKPTQVKYMFAPLPTISEVCKEAILTGLFPADCRGNLLESICRAYSLTNEQLSLAANWRDAERLQLSPKTKMVVYRDNRIDDQLKSAGSYRALAEDFPNTLSRMSRLVRRWVDDFRLMHDRPPLVLLTADHGFTFGPAPGSETEAHRHLDGAHRCIALTENPTDNELASGSLTFLDKEAFHLRTSYLAARGRSFGHGTVSGWVLSHGGLLPEEVIVPVVEWFGDSVALPWPEVTFPDGAVRDRDTWILRVVVRNVHTTTLYGGTLRCTVGGEVGNMPQSLPRLEPAEECSLVFTLNGMDYPEGAPVPIDTTVSLRVADGAASAERVRQVSVPRARLLVEKTNGQVAFEGMF
jgi:hypothetical protein